MAVIQQLENLLSPLMNKRHRTFSWWSPDLKRRRQATGSPRLALAWSGLR